jgi:large subunit ribosomal protein L24
MSGWREKMFKQLMKSGNNKRNAIVKPAMREAAKKKRWDIVRGDKVQVISRDHPENGKQGIVQQVIRRQDRVIVEGINLHSKRVPGDSDRGIKGTTELKERALHYSNVNLVDPLTGKPTRVFRKILEDGSKVRVSKVSGAVIPKSDMLKMAAPRNSIVTEDDTPEDAVWEISYPLFTGPEAAKQMEES